MAKERDWLPIFLQGVEIIVAIVVPFAIAYMDVQARLADLETRVGRVEGEVSVLNEIVIKLVTLTTTATTTGIPPPPPAPQNWLQFIILIGAALLIYGLENVLIFMWRRRKGH